MMLHGERPDGATSADGRVSGTYVHGLFAGDAFRAAYLAAHGARSALAYDRDIDRILDDLAGHLGAALDIEAVLEISGYRARS
ncbi:MAG: hypothetical protein Tsb0019_41190 [Roseibium sp.]